MPATLQVEVLEAGALGEAERAAWRAMQAANPALDHPYFDLRYAEAAAAVAPRAQVAVLHRGGAIAGFLPFQRRGRRLQPLGAPMSDYHGVVAAPQTQVDLDAVARALGGTFRFNGLKGCAAPDPGWTARRRMAARTGEGREALEAGWEAREHKFFKNLRRLERGLVRDHGELQFTWSGRDAGVLDWIVTRKREQYRRTHRHDVFACGWTERLLRRLLESPDADFGLRTSALRVGGVLVAAEAALVGPGVCHLWFPTYEAAYRKYGPGMVMTARELTAAAETGYRWVDFGCGDEGYKTAFAEPVETVHEGVAGGPAHPAAALTGSVLARGPAPLRRLGASVGRRLDIINACETETGPWLAGVAGAGRAMLARRGAA